KGSVSYDLAKTAHRQWPGVPIEPDYVGLKGFRINAAEHADLLARIGILPDRGIAHFSPKTPLTPANVNDYNLLRANRIFFGELRQPEFRNTEYVGKLD